VGLQRWVRGEDDWHKYLFIHQECVREKYFNDKVLGIKTKPSKGSKGKVVPAIAAPNGGLKKSDSMAKLEDETLVEDLGPDAVALAVLAQKCLNEDEVLTQVPRGSSWVLF
jgi:hypothetical protein